MDVTKQICILDQRKEMLTFKTKHVTILEAANTLYNRISFFYLLQSENHMVFIQ